MKVYFSRTVERQVKHMKTTVETKTTKEIPANDRCVLMVITDSIKRCCRSNINLGESIDYTLNNCDCGKELMKMKFGEIDRSNYEDYSRKRMVLLNSIVDCIENMMNRIEEL